MGPTSQQRTQFTRDGYVIVRGLVPTDELGRILTSVDAIVEKANHPSSVDLTDWVDRKTANALECCVDDRIYNFSCALMHASDAAGEGLNIHCRADTGWHRDIQPSMQAPLDGLQEDLRVNGVPYVQWNIALRDDPYFHVIPGSHVRRNNEAEREIERRDGVVSLPGITCIDLKAGDGIVYVNTILHSAKPSGENKRRTYILGYEGFGIRNFAQFVLPKTLGIDFVQHLSPWAAKRFRLFEQLHAERLDDITDLFKSMVDRHVGAFRAALARIHPSPQCRITTLAILSKIARELHCFKEQEETGYRNGPRIRTLVSRFSVNEIDDLWSRFTVLDGKLQTEDVELEPLFQGEKTRYYIYDMPSDFEVEEFINTWG